VQPDVLVIGAGIIGGAIAWALAGAGRRVALVERDRPGVGASSAAFGILQPQAGPGTPPPLLALWQAALDRYPSFVAAIEAESGLGVEFRSEGRLLVALDAAREAALATFLDDQRAAGIPAEPLTAAQVRALEPDLSPAVRGGVYLPAQRLVDNRRLVRAVALAAARRGAELIVGQPVQSLLVEDGRVTGALVGGAPQRAGLVVNAAGCWAGRLDPRFPAPVTPVRGQGVALEDAPPRFRHVIHDGRCSLVARHDGRLLIGTTSEPAAGYAATVTAAAIAELLAAAIALAPVLATRPVVGSWAGLRPGTPDGLPLIGPSARAAGLLWATGHAGMGILLAPLTAALVDELVRGAPPSIDLAPFAPARFDPAA
jgi:glycine oxidase